jgi:Ribbon-helix-helix protein, copG family
VATTIHVPQSLLQKVDERAKALGKSRNRFIVDTLADKVQASTQWPEEFVSALKRPVSRDVAALAEQMLRQIKSRRLSRKAPPHL